MCAIGECKTCHDPIGWEVGTSLGGMPPAGCKNDFSDMTKEYLKEILTRNNKELSKEKWEYIERHGFQ